MARQQPRNRLGRRTFLKLGLGAAAVGLLAGCTGKSTARAPHPATGPAATRAATLDLTFAVWSRSFTDFESTYRDIAAAGVRTLVLSVKRGQFDLLVPEDARQAKRILDQLGLAARACHGLDSPGYELGEPDEALRTRMIHDHLRLMENVAAMGVRTYVFHLGKKPGAEPKAAGRERIVRALDALAPTAQKLGLVLALENGLSGYRVTSAELLKLVTDYAHPAVGICYDSGHAHITGDAVKDLALLSPHVVTVHLHDNDGKQDEHLFPGEGTIDWPAVVAGLPACPKLRHVETEAANTTKWPRTKKVLSHRDAYELYAQLLNSPGSTRRYR